MNFIEYLTEEDFLLINEEQIKRYGGQKGLIGIAQPNEFQYLLDMVEDDYYYPSLIDKAALYVEKIITNHIFHDGNKRTAAMVLDIFLKNNGYRIKDRVLPVFSISDANKTIPSQTHRSNTTGLLKHFFEEIAQPKTYNWKHADIKIFIENNVEKSLYSYY